MAIIRFIHTGDVHLDSPLDQLRKLDRQTAEAVERASRHSFETVVNVALEREVAALVIAGDLFDGPVKDASGALWVDSLLKKLSRAGIAVLLIQGNHDAQSNAARVTKWSAGITNFGISQPATVLLDNCGLAIHGQSFGLREVKEDLAAKYPDPVAGYFNIGLLHTSLSGNAAHDTYAPTSIEVLASRGYQYWALGHIHKRSEQSLSSNCWIGYCGNTQGRHIRETGPKGCHLVHVEDHELSQVEFIATDSVRWSELTLDISSLESLGDLDDAVCEGASEVLSSADSRHTAVRIRLSGATRLHSELTNPKTVDEVTATLAERLSEMGQIWLESVKVATSAPRINFAHGDLELPLNCLSEIVDEIRNSESQRKELFKSLEEIGRKVRSDLLPYGWGLWNDATGQDEFERMLRQAEELLVARISSEVSR